MQSWGDPNDVWGLLWDGRYLWAATGGGIVRRNDDGSEPRLFDVRDGLPSRATRGIALDGDGHIWVGYADSGAWSEWNGRAWRTYATRREAVETRYAALLAARKVHSCLWGIRPGSRWLWLPTPEGQVQAYDGRIWRQYGDEEGAGGHIWMVAVAPQGQVWAIGSGLSLSMEGRETWRLQGYCSAVPDKESVRAAWADANGGVWLAFSGSKQVEGGVCRLDPATGRWTTYSHSLNVAIPRDVYDLEADSDGILWLFGSGQLAWQAPASPWGSLALGALTVRAQARDSAGGLWLGTDSGVWRLDAPAGQQTPSLPATGPWRLPSHLRGNQVRGLSLDGLGSLWVATDTGLTRLRPGASNELLLRGQVVGLAAGPGGVTWLASGAGLSTVSAEGSMRVVLSEPVTALCLDRTERVWATVATGSIVVSPAGGNESMQVLTPTLPFPARQIAIGRDSAAWFATAGGLVMVASTGEMTRKVADGELPSSDVRSLAFGRDGSLWVGTAGGMARRLASGQWVRYTRTSTEGGLRSEDIRALAFDDGGTLWVGTAEGISRRSPEADWSYLDLPGVRTILPASVSVAWVGTLGGLYRVEAGAFTGVP